MRAPKPAFFQPARSPSSVDVGSLNVPVSKVPSKVEDGKLQLFIYFTGPQAMDKPKVTFERLDSFGPENSKDGLDNFALDLREMVKSVSQEHVDL
jgi:hypothetical protein